MDTGIIIKQLSRLKYLLSLPDTDVCWSSYDNAKEAIDELEMLEKGILKQDKNAIDRLRFLLLPTASLQEISISSGWGYEFLSIAESLENVLKNLHERP